MTLLDFPGKVACTVFTGGCNLRCPFCHNYELVTSPCSNHNMYDEVMEYLSKRKGILDGVCVTGGEPLLQPDIEEFLKDLKKMGYLIKLDTNGSLPKKLRRVIEESLVDYVAMDIKSSPSGYEKATASSMDFGFFKESVEILENSGVPHEFRTTAVKGIHTAVDFEQIGKLLEGTEKYFIQNFKDSQFVPFKSFFPFSEEESEELLNTVKKFIPTAQLRGQ